MEPDTPSLGGDLLAYADAAWTPKAVTSRSKSPALFTVTNDHVGIDTVRLRGRLTQWPDPELFKRHVDSRTPSGDRRITSMYTEMGTGVTLHVDTRWGLHAWMEVSIPNWLWDTNVNVATVTQMRTAATCLYEDAGRLVSWGVDADQLSVTRIDTVRTFSDVEDYPTLLEGLRLLELPYRPGVTAWTNANLTTSIRRGPKGGDWRARLYGKREECLPRAVSIPPESSQRQALLSEAQAVTGMLRYELVARTPVLKRYAVGVLADVSENGIRALNQGYFCRAGFDREVGGMTKLKDVALIAEAEGDRKDIEKAFAMLLMELLGLPTTNGEKTRQRLARVAKKYGISAADFAMTDRPSVRLDYLSGTAIRDSR
ncbi:hypothetical protein BH24ACT15_BH24ACT15_35960 [soil metagenome]